MTYIMFNRCVKDRHPLYGMNEYVVFVRGRVVRRFTSSPRVADRYSRMFGVTPASPMDYMREVVWAD